MARRQSAYHRWSVTGLTFALLSSALWGLAPVATKAALDGFSAEFIGFFRLAAAAAIFRLLAGPSTSWFVADPWVWVAGAALGLDFILYNYGMQRTSANVAGLVINVEMVSTIAFAVWLLGERVTARRLLGSAVTLAGVLVVSMDGLRVVELGDQERFLGNGLVMAAGVSWSVFAIAQQRSRVGRNLFQRLTPIFAVAALTTAPMLLRPGAWRIVGGLYPSVMLGVLVVLGTSVVYWLYGRAQQLIDVSVLAVLLSSIPVFTVAFAYLMLGEHLTQRLLLGGVIVVAGILVIATETHTAPEAPLSLDETDVLSATEGPARA